jgi:hypothetical protein
VYEADVADARADERARVVKEIAAFVHQWPLLAFGNVETADLEAAILAGDWEKKR